MNVDELLSTHTIPELRDIVSTLERDALEKKTELQLMVGSKYHDFIQSADMIADMHGKTQELERKLGDFWTLSQSLVSKTYDLLSRTDKSPTSSKFSGFSAQIVNSTSVWDYLETCDIYNATRLVLVANALLGYQNSEYFGRLQSSDANKATAKYCEDDLLSVLELSQTVMDDAKLMLFDPSLTPGEKAKLLVSIGALGGLNRLEMLSLYLETAGIIMDTLLREQGDDSDEDEFGSSLVSAAAHLQQIILDVHNLFLRQVSIQMTPEITQSHKDLLMLLKSGGLVSLYQSFLIRDVAKSLSVSDSTNNSLEVLPSLKGFDAVRFCEKQVPTTTANEYRKLFDHWLANIISKISKASDLTLSKMTSATEVAKLQLRVWQSCTSIGPVAGKSQLSYQAATLISSAEQDGSQDHKLKLEIDSLHKLFDPQYKPSIANGSSAVPLSSLIQQHRQGNTNSHSSSNIFAYSQNDWNTACSELLHSRKRASEASESTSKRSEPHTFMWTIAFMSSFMHQVERLLRHSCLDILGRIRGDIIASLADFGLEVDDKTLTLIRLESSAQSSQRNISNPNSTGASRYSRKSALFASASSSLLFNKAERIRLELENEVSVLLDDIISPIKDGDPMSTGALSHALYVQLSQLVAQLLVSLRVLSTSLSTYARSSAHGYPARQSHSHAETGVNYVPAFDAHGLIHNLSADAKVKPQHCLSLVNPISSGLLFIGRICWLLKIKGRFVEEALSPFSGSDDKKMSTRLRYDLCSEEQFISACEIADADGDGVLTYAEAVEAYNALSFSDGSESEGEPALVEFLSPTMTPTVTFAEFALLCPDILMNDPSDSVRRLRQCCDIVSSYTSVRWAEITNEIATTDLLDKLFSEFDLQMTIKKGSESIEPAKVHSRSLAEVKSNWISIVVDLVDPDTDSALQEKLLIPAQCTFALLDYLYENNYSVCRGAVSIDTAQRLPDILVNLNSPQQADLLGDKDNCEVLRLASFISSTMQLQALNVLLNIYGELSSFVETHIIGNDLEELALQALFDVMVCAHIAKTLHRNYSASGEQSQSEAFSNVASGFDKLISAWESHIDPINFQLISSPLSSSLTAFCKRIDLLLCNLLGCSGQSELDGAGDVRDSPSKSKSKPSAASSVFLAPSCQRFALLPLPVSTQAIISSATGSGMGGGSQGMGRGTAGGKLQGNKSKQAEAASKAAAELAGANAANAAAQQSTTSFMGRQGFMSSLGNLLGTSGYGITTDK